MCFDEIQEKLTWDEPWTKDPKHSSYQNKPNDAVNLLFTGISWALYNLAKYPDLQKKCRNEVNAVLNRREFVEW